MPNTAADSDGGVIPERQPVAVPEASPDPVQLVRQAWENVLCIDTAPLDTGFFDAGGSSMLLVMLADELADLTGRELDVAELFRHDTVLKQARLLDPDHETDNRPAPPAATGRGRLLGAGRRGRGGTAPTRSEAQPEGSAAR
ncbi:acyl carrier protein [Streptomyces sp. S.PNR 29]|uniref:acyl carrier protein n=1 Tax=Streptomyces sp. S.PNR 29 TaxID=2973805 RepID=UPI0025AEEEAD|nr:acyl carrier protein [Streptomyces sp. S.PNR 29]MDN0196779.1 acyl carrier protein [Streptomyces sp. S.PNR 29]